MNIFTCGRCIFLYYFRAVQWVIQQRDARVPCECVPAAHTGQTGDSVVTASSVSAEHVRPDRAARPARLSCLSPTQDLTTPPSGGWGPGHVTGPGEPRRTPAGVT